MLSASEQSSHQPYLPLVKVSSDILLYAVEMGKLGFSLPLKKLVLYFLSIEDTESFTGTIWAHFCLGNDFSRYPTFLPSMAHELIPSPTSQAAKLVLT